MNNENIQHTINATEGERQLSIVGNNFKETDEVAKDGYTRDPRNWKPKYWILYYPLDYLMFIILKRYETRLWKSWLQFDCSEKTLNLIRLNYDNDRNKYIDAMLWFPHYTKFLAVKNMGNLYHHITHMYGLIIFRRSIECTKKYQIPFVVYVLRKYFTYRNIINKSILIKVKQNSDYFI